MICSAKREGWRKWKVFDKSQLYVTLAQLQRFYFRAIFGPCAFTRCFYYNLCVYTLFYNQITGLSLVRDVQQRVTDQFLNFRISTVALSLNVLS